MPSTEFELADPDWGQVYRRNVDAVVTLVEGLDAEQLALVVPATPGWAVHEVLAHLAGAPADLVTGRMDGAPAPEWTTRHVSERVGLAVPDLVEELVSHQDAVVAQARDNPRPVIVWDIAVHHADLRSALGLGAPEAPYWLPVIHAVAPIMLGPHLEEAEGIAPYELFRGLFSRRSRAQLQAWGLPLSLEELDGICVFGPRGDDEPVAAGPGA